MTTSKISPVSSADLRRIVEDVVTNLVASPHHFKRVSIRFGVVARAAVTGPAFLAQLS